MEATKQKVYKRVFDMACADLTGRDIEDRAMRAGALYRGEDRLASIEVPWFDDTITVHIPGFSFKSAKGASVSLVMKIIVLHYLVRASGGELLQDHVSYEDIPGTRQYLPVFEKRVTRPLASAFGYDRDAFLESGLALGGMEEEYGNASFTLFPLPRVPITFILWEGDQEFPPSVKVLFNPSIHTYLPLEDIGVLAKLATTRIIAAARARYAQEVME